MRSVLAGQTRKGSDGKKVNEEISCLLRGSGCGDLSEIPWSPYKENKYWGLENPRIIGTNTFLTQAAAYSKTCIFILPRALRQIEPERLNK